MKINLSCFNIFFTSLIFVVLSGCSASNIIEEKNPTILPPDELYGPLFYDVQTDENIFEDSKTFVDAVPLYDVAIIRNKYAALKDKSSASLKKFVENNFELPTGSSTYVTDSSSINIHISKLWGVLKRPADKKISGTLIPLPEPYIVPGGRFREVYYWDSYFTILGLAEDNELETIENMIDNFSYLINEKGFIPNGNRTYYLGRSQPPFYSLMVEILAANKSDSIYSEYLEPLEKEYNFWMKGKEDINSSRQDYLRVVMMPDGSILNRYWDTKNTPRPESYREDVATADKALSDFPNLKREDIYRNLRAGAESGWDFSSRWLNKVDGEYKLATIHTTDIVPVDLNSLLYNLEMTLSKSYLLGGDPVKAEIFNSKANARKEAILKYCWNTENGFFMDYNFKKNSQTEILSLAGVYPLFFNIAEENQAELVQGKIKEIFLKPGGLVTTPNHTGQQWDAPNGWAPLQWMAIKGLRNYGYPVLANDIKGRWIKLNREVYKKTFKMLEKYNVEDLSKESGGGEYPTQDGFGWTNGVFQKLSKE
ncbi:alpha,alpha-trehalase [Gillisia sp. Hel_I_86]|uniref:alpha,alpha-trehalase TreA n=1 Tax=Gillisia sp. Hel_I_86 TaxID=1249981 RepID=UPI00119B6500|nr:alpha,alpha-trehalase TreA [Gillisia sp. Hel_I_86]TVZ28018.1 alpha,alpha-trehalase [Gillisia sp. Hel_I_86]